MDIKTIIIVGLIFGIIGLGSYYHFNPNEIEKIVEDNSPLINVEVIGFYENVDDSSKGFYSYYINNYGKEEAKNIMVRCKTEDKNGKLILSILNENKNIASKSSVFEELETTNINVNSYPIFSYCYVESCDNCKILYKEIPELKKGYENEN